MSEIVEYAGEYFDPYSVDSIAAAMVCLFRNEDRRKELRRLSLDALQSFHGIVVERSSGRLQKWPTLLFS